MKPDPLDDEELLEFEDEFVDAAPVSALAALPEDPPEPEPELPDDPLPALTSSPTALEIDAIVPALGA
jgi:hypothetical protein